MAKAPSQEWLERVNTAMANSGTGHRGRPWRAWSLWAQETGNALDLAHPDVRFIFEWFAANTKASSQVLGPMYLGAFYYDAEFWPLSVPIAFGTVRLSPVESLASMPQPVVARMSMDIAAMTLLMNVFADCVDVAFYIDEAQQVGCSSKFCRSLLESAYDTLRTLAPLLLMSRPSPKAMQTSRFATEIFLKAFLAATDGLTESTAKKPYGHRLDLLAKRCLEVAPKSEFDQVFAKAVLFPSVDERYQNSDWQGAELWDGYRIALLTAATVVRMLTSQDTRAGFTKSS